MHKKSISCQYIQENIENREFRAYHSYKNTHVIYPRLGKFLKIVLKAAFFVSLYANFAMTRVFGSGPPDTINR